MMRFEEEQALALAAVQAVPGWQARHPVAEPAIPVLASPSWRGVDGAPWRVRDERSGESLFVKIMHADAALAIDLATAFEATRRASDLGIGPQLRHADLGTGVLVLEDLDRGWRVGTLDRLLDPGIVAAVAKARLAFQAGPPLPKADGVFAEIDRFHAAAVAAGAALPSDLDALLADLGVARAALAAVAASPVPIHGDGNVSNVLISDTGAVRLVDWDRATTADPLEDWGSFLAEAFEQDPEARDTFMRLCPGADESRFNRARLYGVADDMRWGLIATLHAARSARSEHEFMKFANWRFLRCRIGINDPRFAERIRRVA